MTADKRNIRRTIGENIQIQGDYAHIDVDGLANFGVQAPSELVTKVEARELFNSASQNQGLQPLYHPDGYMTLEDNVYDYIKEAYADEFEDTLDKIEKNYSFGTPYALEAVLDKLDKFVRRDVAKLMPPGIKYHELRFIDATDDICDIVDDFAKARVQFTQAYNVRRSVDKSTLENLLNRIGSEGQKLSTAIGEEYKRSNEELGAEYAEEFGSNLQSLQEQVTK